jgi:hypothetical protein
MAKLGDMASLIRSKNAGPFWLTIDVMFDKPDTYEKVKASGQISAGTVARIYGVPESSVLFFYVDNALAVKASIPRPRAQGDVGDADSHGGQQYAPLMEIEIA